MFTSKAEFLTKIRNVLLVLCFEAEESRLHTAHLLGFYRFFQTASVFSQERNLFSSVEKESVIHADLVRT